MKERLLPSVVLAAGLTYALSAPKWILGGDNAEFATLFATGGIAHPPGYPAMILWLRAFHWLPAATAAQGAALATALCGTLAVYLFQRACLGWGVSPGTTAVVSALFAFSPMAWKMSCHAEVFAMNAANAAAILWLSAPKPPARGQARVVLLGLVAGFGIADQQSLVLMFPVGLWGLYQGVKESPKAGRSLLLGALAFVAGLIPPYVYVYVLARTADPRTTYMWMDRTGLAGVWFHFRRGAYGTLSLAGTPVKRQPLGNLAVFAPRALRHLLGLPVLALGAVAWARRVKSPRRPREEVVALAMVGLAFVLAGPVFIAWFNLPFNGAGPTVAERFYLFPELLLSLLAAVAIEPLIGPRLSSSRYAVAATLVVGVVEYAIALPEIREHNRPSVENYVMNTLKSAPANAVVVESGDHRLFGFIYAQNVLHLRPDVSFVNPGPMGQAWYRRDLGARIGVNLDTPSGGPIGPLTLSRRLMMIGRPVLYTDFYDPKLEPISHYSVGTLMHITKEGDLLPQPAELERQNTELFERFTMEPTLPKDPFGWGYGLMKDYARPWVELANAYGEEGDAERALACFARAKALAPEFVSGPE